MTQLRRSFPVLSLVLLGGCVSRQSVGLSANIQTSNVAVQLGTQGKTDLLFMIDNSPSMDAMQAELRAHIGDLMAQLAGLNKGKTLDLHVGVVTSDYGAGDVPAGPCQASPGGQRGHLQAIGAAADAGCKAPVGAPYVAYHVDDQGVVTSNLPPGQDLLTTFTCMASVGAGGCGFEHQLESVYAALHDTTTNAGFLRDDATLAILFLTNEDDGSAPPTAKFYEPAADLVEFGDYDTFRQTRFAVECGGALVPYAASGTALADCGPAPAPPGLAYDVSRYIDYFTTSGGVKSDPSLVLLMGIEAPSSPVQTILADAMTGLGTTTGVDGQPVSPSYTQCPALASGCEVRLQHSCQNSAAPAFFGDPAVRLEAVIDAAATHRVWSICGDDGVPPDYGSMMSDIGSVMAAQAAGGCMPGALATPKSPNCTVTTADLATVPQCVGTATDGCWRIVSDPICPPFEDPTTGAADRYRLVIGAGAGAIAHASCLTYSST